jgi:hypothetical protein
MEDAHFRQSEEDDVSKDIKKLEDRHEYLSAALESRIQVQNDIPYIQQDLELTDWQLRALQQRPPESVEIPYKSRSDELEKENRFLRTSIPVFKHPVHPTLYSTTASITTSGSSDTYEFINRVRDLGTPDAINYGDAFIHEYKHIQEAQERPQRVRKMLEKLNSPNTLERFDIALLSYNKYKSDPKEKTAAANGMRNLLLGVQGELWERARRWPDENMTWSTMSARLSINGGRGQEHITLDNQKRVKGPLFSRLAEVLKDREGGSLTNLDTIWTEVIDFLFTVLGLINVSTG